MKGDAVKRLLATTVVALAGSVGLVPALAATAAAAPSAAHPAVAKVAQKPCGNNQHNKHCPYPPNANAPYSTESASEVHTGQPDTLCGKNFSGNVPLTLTDNGRFVTTLQTNGSGDACVTLTWSSADGVGQPGGASPAAYRFSSGARASYVLAAAYLPRAAAASRSHTMTFTGHDKLGVVGSTSQQVTVTGKTSGATAASSSSSGSSLPFTGLDIAAAVAAAAALIVAGMVLLTGARRRRGVTA